MFKERYFGVLNEADILVRYYVFLDEEIEDHVTLDGHIELTSYFEGINHADLLNEEQRCPGTVLAVRGGKIKLINPFVFEEGGFEK